MLLPSGASNSVIWKKPSEFTIYHLPKARIIACPAYEDSGHRDSRKLVQTVVTVRTPNTVIPLTESSEEPCHFKTVGFPALRAYLASIRSLDLEAKAAAQINATPTNSNGYLLATGLRANEYYHWFHDQLPKIVLAELNGFKGIYIVPKKTTWVKDSLALLRIHDDRILEFNAGVLDIENLHVFPSLNKKDKQGLYALALPLVRDRLVKAIAATSPRPSERVKQLRACGRIYVARKVNGSATGRHVENDAEVTSLLAQYGFTKIFMEDFSLREQILLMHGNTAKTIVGPHGAGLSHLLWSGPGSTLIEFLTANYHNDCFQVLCERLGHTYFNCFCSRTEHFRPALTLNASITVNTVQLRALLSGLS